VTAADQGAGCRPRQEAITVNGPRVVLDGLGFPESTRWHDGRLWLCNWGSGEVLAVTPDGEPKVVARLAPRTIPFSIDWLPDGPLLVVDGPRRLLLRQQVPGGSLEVAADLRHKGMVAFSVIGSLGLIGGLAVWAARCSWHVQISAWAAEGWGGLWSGRQRLNSTLPTYLTAEAVHVW